MSKKVITFGEIMIRLQTPGFQRFIQADSLEMVFGGGEANVAVPWQTMEWSPIL